MDNEITEEQERAAVSRSLDRMVRRLSWRERPSDDGRFKFLVGEIHNKIVFTAAPKRFDGRGGWNLRVFLLGEREIDVKEGRDPKQVASEILRDAIEMIVD